MPRNPQRTLRAKDEVDLCVEALTNGFTVTLTVRGRSMLPTLHDGDRILVRPARHEDARPGVLVVYRLTPSDLVAHRIVAVDDGPDGLLLWERGDSSPRSQMVEWEQIIGVVAAVRQIGADSPAGADGRSPERVPPEGCA
jgi:signal peptidase I